MNIIVREVNFKSEDRILISFKSDVIPRIGEFLYLPHFGKYKVFEIIHHITDDNIENNINMWVELEVRR